MSKPRIEPAFFARNPARHVFDVGPFPTREDAQNDAPELMGLAPGTAFEIGKMLPYCPYVPDPRISNINHLEEVQQDANPTATQWMKRLSDADRGAIEELAEALELVFYGWLLKHDMVPKFGHVIEISTHTA